MSYSIPVGDLPTVPLFGPEEGSMSRGWAAVSFCHLSQGFLCSTWAASEQQRWAGPETPASCEFLDSEQELPQNLQPGVLQGAGLVVPRSQPACLPLSKSW